MNGALGFMDLTRQIRAHRDEFLEAVSAVMDDAAFSGGKYAEQFEKEFASYIGAAYCSGVASGTAALFLAMRALGVGKGDEVIIPANTFIASAWGACYCGAKPVFADCTPDTWEIDPASLEEKITPRTKAVVGVHLYGHPFDVDAVREIAGRHGIFVVEDCAQAHGALYKGKRVGALCDIGCFSFYPGKNLGSFGEAGAVVTDHSAYRRAVEIMKNHGSSVRYYHDTEGYNLRMDGIQGAVLSVKLKYLDEMNRRRREIAARYHAQIRNSLIRMQRTADYAEPVWHLFEIEADSAERFIAHMQRMGIRCGRHYPVPCHLQKVFSELGVREGMLPNAEYHAKHCVTLPMFPEMTDEEVERVISACTSYKGE